METVLQSDYACFYNYHQYVQVSFVSHNCQHLLLSVFLLIISTIPLGVYWYFILLYLYFPYH